MVTGQQAGRPGAFGVRDGSRPTLGLGWLVGVWLFGWCVTGPAVGLAVAQQPSGRLDDSLRQATSGWLEGALATPPVAGSSSVGGQEQASEEAQSAGWLGGPQEWTSPQGLSSSLQILLLLTVLSLAPAILLMTTCYVRIIVVLGLLRQALGTPQLPPSQVVTAIALFMTLFVMTPVWNRVYEEAIEPYTDPDQSLSLEQLWERGSAPVKDFLARQIDMAGNHDDVHLFLAYDSSASGTPPTSFAEVPMRVLLPAYMLSELKVAFLIGFQLYLPFLILDMVIASVTISMGMMMLPPAMISMPFKLLLFVLVDGWRLVVQMLLESFGTYGAG
jgi:flagellar biosynthesis protein FliP